MKAKEAQTVYRDNDWQTPNPERATPRQSRETGGAQALTEWRKVRGSQPYKDCRHSYRKVWA